MIIRRSVPVCIILSIVTCGSYMLYWWTMAALLIVWGVVRNFLWA